MEVLVTKVICVQVSMLGWQVSFLNHLCRHIRDLFWNVVEGWILKSKQTECMSADLEHDVTLESQIYMFL